MNGIALISLTAWGCAMLALPALEAADPLKHWAFEAPRRPAVPEGEGHPIDAFIAQRLRAEGLGFSPPAPAEKLRRRLCLDLVGLPPKASQLSQPEKELVESLLASPHHGERWGRLWLDAAHYADSNGYEKDPMRHIWFYRDWVIEAINRDLPYSQFLIEQLAGDQLPKPTQAQIVATGFLRNSMINEEGGVDPEQFRMEAMFDRMDTLGKSVLGLTLGCSQCHDHKYDPISQREYYQLMAFLNNDNEPWRVVYTAAEQQQRAALLRQWRMMEEAQRLARPQWRGEVLAWLKTLERQPNWQVLAFEDDPSGGEKALRQSDGSILAQGYAPTRSEVRLTLRSLHGHKPAPLRIAAVRLELLNDPNLPAYGPGRSQKGTAALTEFGLSHGPQGKAVAMKIAHASADFGEAPNTALVAFARDQDAANDKRVTGPIDYAVDGNALTAWGIDAGPGRRNVPRVAVFVLQQPLVWKPGEELAITLSMKHGGWNSDDLQTMNLGRYRLSVCDDAQARADPLPPRIRAAMARGPLSEEVLGEVFALWRARQPPLAQDQAAIEALWKQHPEGSTTLVLDAREQARATHLLKRGDFLKPAERVDAAVPAALHPLPRGADGSRLSLARWLASPDSPTTARVIVNRVWQTYFGTGLVDTPEDFGLQGSKPSHPQLLDWLACELMEHQWSLKHLHRLITSSRTYRQDSVVSAALLQRDPDNRLLARASRLRVEAEVLRDIQLSVSGLLDASIGGRPVMPPAPQYLFEKPASYAPFPWRVEGDSQKYRRAVYVFRRRSTPYPFLATFDAPNGEASCLRRARSNTPLQALMTLNETLSLEAAEHLGRRLEQEAARSDERLALSQGFVWCTARQPTPREQALLHSAWAQLREEVQPGERPAWALLARVLLNLDETVTRE